jgi:hypothetical protein
MVFSEEDRNWVLRAYDSLEPNACDVARQFHKNTGRMMSNMTVCNYWEAEGFSAGGRGGKRNCRFSEDDKNLILRLYDSLNPSTVDTARLFYEATGRRVTSPTVLKFWRAEDFPGVGPVRKKNSFTEEDKDVVIELRFGEGLMHKEIPQYFERKTGKSISCSSIYKILGERRE